MSTENKDRQEEQQATNRTVTETQEQDNGLPKTQEELDALIAKRIARERKKMNSQQQGQTPQKTGRGNLPVLFIKLLYYRVFLQATLLSLSFLSTSFRVIWSAQSQVFAA